MTTIDFSPAPGAAPPVRRVIRHALIEARLLTRNGEQLLLALVIPIGLLVGGRFFGGRFGELSTWAPSVLALAVWSSAFTSVAIATAFERRYGVLERLAATPLGKAGLLAGKAGAVLMIIAGQLVILIVIALALGWSPQFTAGSLAAAGGLVIMAAATFVSLALLLAGRLRPEIVLAVANLVYLIVLVGGALVIPVDRYPAGLASILPALPTAALGEGLRAAASGQVLGWPLLVLPVWLVASAAVAAKGFRWM